jgi:hypothetical protein
MAFVMSATRLAAGVLATVLATGVGARDASAEERTGASCDVVDVEYAVSANLRVRGTVMGAGDGDYAIGPGRIVLRFDRRGPLSAGATSSVQMISYEVSEKLLVVSKAVFWTTKVKTDTRTHGTPTTQSAIAEGALKARSLVWSKVAKGFRSDGTLDCDGSMCGKFGAPPAGKSELHLGPSAIQFKPFEFSPDMKTFSMQSTLALKTDVPKQESYVSLAGRETRRVCLEIESGALASRTPADGTSTLPDNGR